MITASIITPIDTTPGDSAVDYSEYPGCPVLRLHCVSALGSGEIKITPFKSSEVIFNSSGSGARIRLKCDARGSIVAAEIASGGQGYPDGEIENTIKSVWGSGGSLKCISSEGSIVSVDIEAPGINYDGYVSMNIENFIEGVTYNIMPRFIEKVGSGTVIFLGYRTSTKPFQTF